MSGDLIRVPDLYAWIGLDELGSGRVGIKIGNVPAGRIPLAAMDYDFAKLARLAPQMHEQATAYGHAIKLARFTFVEDSIVVTPDGTIREWRVRR